MELSDYIWQRDNSHCIYCGAFGQCIDHVLAKSRGGKTRKENLVLACNHCNGKKKDSLDLIWITKAFNHLLKVGESLDWVDGIWTSNRNPRTFQTQRRPKLSAPLAPKPSIVVRKSEQRFPVKPLYMSFNWNNFHK